MLKSMTAYGRSEKRSTIGSATVEVQSLNRKFLDISIYLPKELSAFDILMRKQVASFARRGKVSVNISIDYEESTPIKVRPNLPLARQIKAAWEKLEAELDITSSVDLKVISQMPDVMQFYVEEEAEAPWEELVVAALEEALFRADRMRLEEGEAIYDDFLMRLDLLEKQMQEVQSLSPQVKERFREKLRETLTDASMQTDFEERLLREVCVYAEKVDITEEVTRFYSHLKQFKAKMDDKMESAGKTLEFLLQEMQREVNTVGSKAQDLQISRLVVAMKSEIERIREQVQNVE
jgi:uncharacterized protein (TIGR00255 family)